MTPEAITLTGIFLAAVGVLGGFTWKLVLMMREQYEAQIKSLLEAARVDGETTGKSLKIAEESLLEVKVTKDAAIEIKRTQKQLYNLVKELMGEVRKVLPRVQP